MPRRNRIDPWGDLHAVSERGLFTGNRGCLVDDRGRIARHHRGPLVDHLPPRLPGLEAPTRPTPDVDTDLLPRRGGRTRRGTPSLWPLPTTCLRRLPGCRFPGRGIVSSSRCRRPEPTAGAGTPSTGTGTRPRPRSNTDLREDRSTASRHRDRRSRPAHRDWCWRIACCVSPSPDGPSHDQDRGP